MKQLVVIRHAKSSWDNPSLDDFDRPLNSRGKSDAPEMGRRLKALGIFPDKMISSPAKRAFATCKKIARELDYAKPQIEKQQSLYHAAPDEILSVVQMIDDTNDTVFIFGHNPGLTEFVNLVGKNIAIENIPTCGVVALRFHVRLWKEIEAEKGELLFFDFPKKRGEIPPPQSR